MTGLENPDRIGSDEWQIADGLSLKHTLGVARLEPGLFRFAVADQVQQRVTVGVLGCGAAETQALFIPGASEGQRGSINGGGASNVGLERMATGMEPRFPGLMLLGKLPGLMSMAIGNGRIRMSAPTHGVSNGKARHSLDI